MSSPVPSQPAATPPPSRPHNQESQLLKECAAFVHKLRAFLPTDHESQSARSAKRAALAALRRGLGKAPGEASEMFPYIIPALPANLDARDTRAEQAHFLIASLFAWHQLDWAYTPNERRANRSFGVSYRRLAEETGSESIEKRFVALLNTDRDGLAEHLRHAVGLLKSREIPIDWTWLLHDVMRWEDADRRVQLRWAQGYWGSFATSRTSANAEQNGPTD